MNSWNPEAVEAILSSQGIQLAPGRAAKIAAALNSSADLADPLLGSLEFESDPTTYSLVMDRQRTR